MLDLLPQSPLYLIVQSAWRSTEAYFSTSALRDTMVEKNVSLAPTFKGIAQWSLHSTHGNAVVAPIDLSDDLPFQEQRAHIAWVTIIAWRSKER
jgi:hypothetical protein